MDAKLFIREYRRMCEASHDFENGCDGCRVQKTCVLDIMYGDMDVDKLVDTVEQWAEEHPVNTRGDLLRKMFPNIRTAYMCPAPFEEIDWRSSAECDEIGCKRCKEEYWNTEVE